MISKSLLVVSVALTVIAVQSAEAKTCTSRCLDGTTKSVTCMGDCSATQQKCTGTSVLGGVAMCDTGSQTSRSCSSSPNPCQNPCRTCSPQMCGTHSDNCGSFIFCGTCQQICPGECINSGKCCREHSDCVNSPGSPSADSGLPTTVNFCVTKWYGVAPLAQLIEQLQFASFSTVLKSRQSCKTQISNRTTYCN